MPEYTDIELIRDQEKLNEHNAAHAGNDLDDGIAYKNHPMSDAQAKSLMSRIKAAFEYRNGILGVDQKWKNSDVEILTISINNINNTINPDTQDYNIEAADDVVDEGYSATNPSANIIKAIDGIAIINSILRINEIDDNIDNIADSSCKRIIKAINNGLSYANSSKQYILNNIIHVDVYPNGNTDTDIVNAKNKYANVILINTETDDFNFNSDDPTDRANQKEYIISVLEDISDIIKYVKTFTTYYVEAYADGSDTHQNITSAFDYYVLDYIVQMIEAENELFNALLIKYEKTEIVDRLSRDDIPINVQRQQNNHAPFVGSMCNGSCVGLCFGTCITTCNGCGSCTSYCSSYCGATCYGECGSAVCTNTCSGSCKSGCMGFCEKMCTTLCGDDCDTSCITACQGECKGTCDTFCNTTCTGQCTTACSDGCSEKCNTVCGGSCQGTTASKNTITNNTINIVTTINNVSQATLNAANAACQAQCTVSCSASSISNSTGGASSNGSCLTTCTSNCGITCGGTLSSVVTNASCNGSCTATCATSLTSITSESAGI